MASHRAVGDAALARQRLPDLHSSGDPQPLGLSATRFDVRTPTRIYPNLLQPGHPLSLTDACRRLEADDDWRPIGFRCAKHRNGTLLTKTVANVMVENQLARLAVPKHGSP